MHILDGWENYEPNATRMAKRRWGFGGFLQGGSSIPDRVEMENMICDAFC